jgi:hypothetical protein
VDELVDKGDALRRDALARWLREDVLTTTKFAPERLPLRPRNAFPPSAAVQYGVDQNRRGKARSVSPEFEVGWMLFWMVMGGLASWAGCRGDQGQAADWPRSRHGPVWLLVLVGATVRDGRLHVPTAVLQLGGLACAAAGVAGFILLGTGFMARGAIIMGAAGVVLFTFAGPVVAALLVRPVIWRDDGGRRTTGRSGQSGSASR